MSILTDYLKLQEEEKRKAGLPTTLVPTEDRSSTLSRMVDPNVHADEKETPGSLGPIDFVASGLYHFANSAAMGLPGMVLPDEYSPYDLDETNTWAKVGGIIGEAAGFLVPITGVGKLLSYPVRAALGTTKTIGVATKAAAEAGTALARTNKALKTRDAAGRFLTKKAAEKSFNESAQKSIEKTMNEAVEDNMQRTGWLSKLFPSKPKKWVESAFHPTNQQSAALKGNVENAVKAGLRKEFKDVPGMTDEVINGTADAFMKGLKEGKHLNTVGAWMTKGLGAGTPNWLRTKMAGYAGRYADMFLTFGVYNTVDEMLHRSLEEGYKPVSMGEIASGTSKFAAVLPLIEAIPGGVSGAMTIKNYRDVINIMKRPKYKDMSKSELTVYYDYIKRKMPGRGFKNLDESLMKVRKDGVPPGVGREDLAASLDGWYDYAYKDFLKMFRGEQGKNFMQSAPRLIAGALYFGGAVNETGFWSEEFQHHLEEDPTSVLTHMLTGMFFTRHRKPLSKDVPGKWGPHKVHFREEYQEQLAMLQQLGYSADGLEFYLSAMSNSDIREGFMGLAFTDIKLGKDISSIMNKAIEKAKKQAADGKYDSALDTVSDTAIIEGYEIWRSSQAHRILNNPQASEEGNTDTIEKRDILHSLSREQRQRLNEEINNLDVRVREDGTTKKVGEMDWHTIRSEVFDKKILDSQQEFFQNYLLSIARTFSMGEGPFEEGAGDRRKIVLPVLSEGTVSDIGELAKYRSIGDRLVEQGRARWATGKENVIKASDLDAVRPDGKTGWEKLAEITHSAEEAYGASVLGKETNVAIDFDNLDITWETLKQLQTRQIMEKYAKLSTNDLEGLSESEKGIYEVIKAAFGNDLNPDWFTYTGERADGSDVLRRGENLSREEWDKRSEEQKAKDEDVMKVLEMMHNIMSYTPLGKASQVSSDNTGRPTGISRENGRALLETLQRHGLVGGQIPTGTLSGDFKRYLFERAMGKAGVSHTDMALIQHVLDSNVGREPMTGADGNAVIELPHPDQIRQALINEMGPGHREEINQLVKDYRKDIFNRLMSFGKLFKTGDKNTLFSDPTIIDSALNPKVKAIGDIVSFREFLQTAKNLQAPKINQSVKELQDTIKLLNEPELTESLSGLIKLIEGGFDGDNASAFEASLGSLREHILSRRANLNEKEKGILDTVVKRGERVLENIKEIEAYEAAGNKEKAEELALASAGIRGELNNSIAAVENIVDTKSGLWKSRRKHIKQMGDLILNFNTENSVKSVIAYSRLKRELLNEIKTGGENETLDQLQKRFEKEGRFADFLEVTRRTTVNALSTLNKEQADALNKVIEYENREWFSHINKVQFTLTADTIARKYKGIFYDGKTKAFSEELKQDILSAYERDIAEGTTEHTAKIIDKMIESADAVDSVAAENFIREELPQLLHSIVSTKRKEQFRFDGRKNRLVQEETHGSDGTIDKYIDWWEGIIDQYNENTGLPDLYITRISRNAISDSGRLGDIDTGDRIVNDILNARVSEELTPELLNKADRENEGGLPIEKILKKAREKGATLNFVVLSVDNAGYDLLIDMNGINKPEVRAKVVNKVEQWYNAKIKRLNKLDPTKASSKRFKNYFGKILSRMKTDDMGLGASDVKDMFRWMYYDRTNQQMVNDLMMSDGREEMGKIQSNLLKYSITAQGENAGRLSSKLGDILKDTADRWNISEGEFQRTMDAIEKFQNKDWKFDVAVMADEGVGDRASLLSSSNVVDMVYNEAAVKEFDKILFKHFERADKFIADEALKGALDLDARPEQIVENFIKALKEIKPLEGKDRRGDIAVDQFLARLERADKAKLVSKLENIIKWRDQSREELKSIGNETSAIDGVTYLSTSAARVIFGLNGFKIGDGFAGVKPIISYNQNEFFGDKINATFIAKTHFVYDPRIAKALDDKGVDIMMGKSAAKSYSGEINLLPTGTKGAPLGGRHNIKDIFSDTIGQIDTKNNFMLPIESIGVVYNARPLHPSKVVPALAIGMNPAESTEYQKYYMEIESTVKDIARNVEGLNDHRREGIVNALLQEATEKGYDLDVGGSGLGMSLFKLGMDASDPFIKREVIRLFHKATGAKLGAIEKPGAGLSVMIPEFDVRMPVYTEIGTGAEKRRRQTKYGGIKIPYDMGTRRGLYKDIDDINFVYEGGKGQDISLRNGRHIDQTEEKFIVKGMTNEGRNAEGLIGDIRDMVKDTPNVNFSDLTVAEIHQLISLRYRSNEWTLLETETDNLLVGDVAGRGHIGGLHSNVRRILENAFGKDYSKSKDLKSFTRRLAESDLGVAVPGARIPSQSFSDVVINRLEGVYKQSYGNVIGSNLMDVLTKHQGDFDVDKMFYYLDSPKSLIEKGIRNSGYNIEPQSPLEQNKEYDVDLLNNNFSPDAGVGTDMRLNDSKDGLLAHKKRLVQNKFLIGRLNRLNYSLSTLRESGFKIEGLEYDPMENSNRFSKIEGLSEKKMGEISQRISNIATILFDPHKKGHKAWHADDHALMSYLLFGDWPGDKNPGKYGERPNKGTGVDSDGNGMGIFNNIKKGGELIIDGRKVSINAQHTQVLKDAYIIALNTVGRAGRVFSGIFDETGQRSPEYWEYNDIKESIERFRGNPTRYIFRNLAWKYSKQELSDAKMSALFDLFVRGKTVGIYDLKAAMSDWREGKFDYTLLSTGFLKHDYMEGSKRNDFYGLTPATNALHGMTPNGNTLYSDVLEGVDRTRYSMYSGHARDLVDNALFIQAFSGEFGTKEFGTLWANAESKILASRENRLLDRQQARDALWHVLDVEMKNQERYLGYLKGNKYANTFDVELATERIEKLRMLISKAEHNSLHGEKDLEKFRTKDLFLRGEESWADVAIRTGNGQKFENTSRGPVTVYFLNTSLKGVSELKSLENVTHDILGKGFTIRAGDWVDTRVGQKYAVLRNPIRHISVDKSEFMHGLAAFAAGTTLTPESFRTPISSGRQGLFYGDVDYVREAIKNEARTLKKNLQGDKNNKSMSFATNNWRVNDILRTFFKRWVDGIEDPTARENRMRDIFEILTLVEPLHGAAASIEGIPNISLPMFIQNRDIFRAVSNFYLRDKEPEGGAEIVKDYLEKKTSFYRIFARESSDSDLIERGLDNTRLLSEQSNILPKELERVASHESLINDIINSPLRRFSDFSLRWALYEEGGITVGMLRKSPNTRRVVSRPWGSPDELFMLEHYPSSMNTDPLKTNPGGRTFGEQAKSKTRCP